MFPISVNSILTPSKTSSIEFDECSISIPFIVNFELAPSCNTFLLAPFSSNIPNLVRIPSVSSNVKIVSAPVSLDDRTNLPSIIEAFAFNSLFLLILSLMLFISSFSVISIVASVPPIDILNEPDIPIAPSNLSPLSIVFVASC